MRKLLVSTDWLICDRTNRRMGKSSTGHKEKRLPLKEIFASRLRSCSSEEWIGGKARSRKRWISGEENHFYLKWRLAFDLKTEDGSNKSVFMTNKPSIVER